MARVRDLLVLPELTLVIDRWDEDWTQLAWLRLYGYGELLDPQPDEEVEHAAAVTLLRAWRYPQYATHDLEHRPIIRVAVERGWSAGASSGDGGRPPSTRWSTTSGACSGCAR